MCAPFFKLGLTCCYCDHPASSLGNKLTSSQVNFIGLLIGAWMATNNLPSWGEHYKRDLWPEYAVLMLAKIGMTCDEEVRPGLWLPRLLCSGCATSFVMPFR